MTDYNARAEQFLKDCGATLDIEYLYTGPYFSGEGEIRDVYRFTLKTPRGVYQANFGDSIHNTERRKIANSMDGTYISEGAQPLIRTLRKAGFTIKEYGFGYAASGKEIMDARKHKPSAYDILACLTKSDPGTFDEFCAEFGYDTDSRSAERTYFAVQNEWSGVRRVFSEEQLEALAEIN